MGQGTAFNGLTGLQGLPFEPGMRLRLEANGTPQAIWVPFTPPQVSAPSLYVSTTIGSLQSSDGRKGKHIIVPVLGGGALFYVSSTTHGKGTLTVRFGEKIIGEAYLSYEPSTKSLVKRLLKSVIFIIVAVVVLRTWVIEGVVTPSEMEESSMAPVIEKGERMFVLRFMYKLRRPFRGEIVVFWHTMENGKKIQYIKRVIGLPGDEIAIRQGVILLNGIQLEEPYATGRVEEIDIPPTLVPPNRYFVLGDNRAYSEDSEYWLMEGREDDAFVPHRELVGKPFVIYWPPNRLQFLFSYKIKVK